MGKKLDPKVAERVMLKAGFQTMDPYVNSTSPWRSKHLACGEIVKPSLSKIKSGRKGCSYCQNRINPKIAINIMIKAKIKPKVKYPGAQLPWKSQCLVCKNLISPNLSGVNIARKNLWILKRRLNL